MKNLLQTRIAGIPCQILVDHFYMQAPMGPSADSDWDCYGYTEIDWTLLDRGGYPADWLAKKLTNADIARIESEIVQAHR